MTNKIIKTRLEYLSLLLVISFFIFHNIYIVFIGIVLSLYIINKNLIDNSLKCSISKTIIGNLNKKTSPIVNQNQLLNTNKEDSEIPLVETIEESGYIPSIEKNLSNDAA